MAPIKGLEKTMAFAELTITGDNIDHNEITKRLGIPPTYALNRGDIRRGSKHVVNYSLWEYNTVKKPTFDLSDQFDELVDVFSGKEVIINEIVSEYPNTEVVICGIVENTNRDYIVPTDISKKAVTFAAKLGIGIQMDNYHFPPSWVHPLRSLHYWWKYNRRGR